MSTNLRTLIIDDEEKARENLKSLLTDFCPNVEVVGMKDSVEDGIAGINEIQPDLVMLDIEMSRGTGFDLLEQLPEINFDIIFITAFHQYAIKAFKFSAADYLLKPISIEELQSAVKRVGEKKARQFSKEQFSHFISTVKPAAKPFNKIALPTMDGLLFVKLEEIVQCSSIDNYTQFHLQSGKKILVSKTIKYFDELLSEHNFFRVHRSHLINLDHIKRYIKGEGGYVIMIDDSQIMVSRRKKEPFLRRFTAQR